MDHTQIAVATAGRDRLTNLGDDVRGHILSFLDAKEAARAAALSSRWRDVLASVHTVSLEQQQPRRPDFIYDDNGNDVTVPYERNQLRLFMAAVTAALFSRSRRPAPAAASVPLRALRVSMGNRGFDDKSTVDQWVSYALRHAAPELELDLRIGRDPVCLRPKPYRLAAAALGEHGAAVSSMPALSSDPDGHSHREENDDDEDVGSSDDERPAQSPNPRPPEYSVLRGLFSCAALRSLSLLSCRLSPPAVISLPALETLRLTQIPDEEENVQRLVSACPRLAELTLEACKTVAVLSLLENRRLRRLALRCCRNIATVAIDASELRSFEYRGAVPNSSLLTVRGGGGFTSVQSCKVDICEPPSEEELDRPVRARLLPPASTTEPLCHAPLEEELDKLGWLLQPFASTTKHLHLCSAAMGSFFVNLPSFPNLRHLELNGRVPRGDDPAAAVAATSRILQQAPNLETLTLFFEEAPHDYARGPNDGVLFNPHHLHYNQYEDIDYAPATASSIPPCLGSWVRKIEVVHYHGGKAQRTLARFLLRNAAVLEKLYCGFAEGPEWIQVELMREIQRWVINETTCKEFR